MPKNFDIDALKLKKTVEDYDLVVMDDEQRTIVDEMKMFILDFITVPESALDDLIQLSISSWQKEEKRHLIELAQENAKSRIEAAKIMFSKVNQGLGEILAAQDQKEELNEIIDNALTLYIAKWSNR